MESVPTWIPSGFSAIARFNAYCLIATTPSAPLPWLVPGEYVVALSVNNKAPSTFLIKLSSTNSQMPQRQESRSPVLVELAE